MKELFDHQVSEIITAYEDGLTTKSNTLMKLLAMIDAHGANSILELCPIEINNLVREWYESSPKSKAGWLKEYVFDGSPNISGMIEYKLAPMTDKEIEARLRVIRDLWSYFNENRK